jgi:hypothetical protein
MEYKEFLKTVKRDMPETPERIWYKIEDTLNTKKKWTWLELRVAVVSCACLMLLSIGFIHQQVHQNAMERFVQSFSSTEYIYEQCQYSKNIYGGAS